MTLYTSGTTAPGGTAMRNPKINEVKSKNNERLSKSPACFKRR